MSENESQAPVADEGHAAPDSQDPGAGQDNVPGDNAYQTGEADTPGSDNSEGKPAEDSEPETSEEDKSDPETPEWFMKDKYKSIEEQAKALPELQKKMGKYWGPPKEEDYKLDDIEGIPEDDPVLDNIKPALKEIGLSQEGFKTLVQKYQEANIETMKSYEEALKKELTQNDAATYNAVDKWMQDNLTNEEKELVQNNWLMTPADFKLFNHLRLMAAPSTNVPSQSDGQTARFESSKEVENDKIKYRKDVSQGIRSPDKNFENELAQRFRDARTRELRNKK